MAQSPAPCDTPTSEHSQLILRKFKKLTQHKEMNEFEIAAFLCSIRLSQVFKILGRAINNGKLNGISLPSPEEDRIKSLLFTADGLITRFKMSVAQNTTLYIKYGVEAISVIVPIDAGENQECSLEHLPQIIEIALLSISGSITYDHPRHSDTTQFTTCEELIKELETLIECEESVSQDK